MHKQRAAFALSYISHNPVYAMPNLNADPDRVKDWQSLSLSIGCLERRMQDEACTVACTNGSFLLQISV